MVTEKFVNIEKYIVVHLTKKQKKEFEHKINAYKQAYERVFEIIHGLPLDVLYKFALTIIFDFETAELSMPVFIATEQFRDELNVLETQKLIELEKIPQEALDFFSEYFESYPTSHLMRQLLVQLGLIQEIDEGYGS